MQYGNFPVLHDINSYRSIVSGKSNEVLVRISEMILSVILIMLKKTIVVLCLHCSLASYAQNLVPNPSFEKYKKLDCLNVGAFTIGTGISPKSVFDSLLYDWTAATWPNTFFLSTLIDSTCNKNSDICYLPGCSANPEAAFHVRPKDGYNITGILLVEGYKKNYNSRSYLQAMLESPLTANTRYLAGCYSTLPNYYSQGAYATNNLGLYFSEQPVGNNIIGSPNVLRYTPQVNQGEVNEDNVNWKKLSGCFTAKGGEQYITIGNFYEDSQTKADLLVPFVTGSDFALYLIDSVFTEEIKDPLIPNVITPNGDGKNDQFKIENVHFGWWGLDVFNRWGRQVFHSDDYRNTWNGDDLSPGVYYYDLRHRCPGISYKGPLTIIR
ncbi:MAG TPA: hypothetical protein DGG95_15000 [Cytophagales bacterium]|jgi:gliding motility-associated-like protein|nr:hypothetical protein [Cytophagales bacterium]